MKSLLSLGAAAAVACAFASLAGAQTAAPTMTGEQLVAGATLGATGTAVITSESCNPNGTSTFSYSANGVATGPYPGTFVEQGTVTMGPQIFSGSAPVTSWTASYTITAATGTVVGTKTLTPPPPGATGTVAGICTSGALPEQRSAATGIGNAQSLAYTATITTATGQEFSDHGLSNASVNLFPDIPQFNNFYEDYTSLQATTTPLCNQNDQTNQNQGGNGQGCANP